MLFKKIEKKEKKIQKNSYFQKIVLHVVQELQKILMKQQKNKMQLEDVLVKDTNAKKLQ